MKYRFNPDEHTRQLERIFRASGAIADAEALFTARMRNNDLSPSDIELLAVLGFEQAQLAFQGLGRSGTPKWNAKTLWQEQGQYRGFKLALSALKFTLTHLLPDDAQIQEALNALENSRLEDYKALQKAKELKTISPKIVNLEKAILATGTEKSWDNRHFVLDKGLVPPALIMQHAALSNLLEIRNMLSPTKGNTFYKIGNTIMNNAILVMASTIEGRPTKKAKAGRARSPRFETEAAAKQEKESMAKLYDEVILPEALQLVLLTSSEAPKVYSKDEDFYKNEIKAGRFSSISVLDPIDDCSRPKKVSQLWSGDGYVTFTVWTSSKQEAKMRADSILYALFGYIPHYMIRSASPKGSAIADLKSGHHEDALFPNGVSSAPLDAISLWRRSQHLTDSEQKELQDQENYICKNIAKLRPDLY